MVTATEGKTGRKVSGFLENGFAVALVAVLAALMVNLIAVPPFTPAEEVAITFVDTAFRIALFMMLVQGGLELFGRESVLLRPDWQRFCGFITGLAMIACGSAVMATLFPLLFA